MEVTQSTFANMAGVSRAAVCTKIKNKTLIMNQAGKLDTDNPVNRAYLDKHQNKIKDSFNFATMGGQLPTGPAVAASAASVAENHPGAAGEMLNMTMREILQNYGNIANVERYSKLLKDLTVADEKEQRIQERRLVQVPKDFVQASVFGFLEALMNKLLDLPERVSDQVIAYVQADIDTARIKIKNLLTDDISAAIGDSKAQIQQAIENMKGKYSQEDSLRDIVSEAVEKE